MTKIERQIQKIFAGNAPTDELAVFGSMNTGNPIYTDNIETLQSANYEDGWSSAIAANEAPFLEEMNGVQYGLSKQIAYQFQEGIPEYDPGTTYFKGSFVKSTDGTGTLYTSLTDNNLGNLLTDRENWALYNTGGAGAPIGSLFPTFCAADFTPSNCLPCNGSEYSSSQFPSFYTNYLTGARLLTCTYEEYASSISTYGKCGKFAVDATVGTFKTPYLPDGSFIQQAMSDTELGKAYDAGLPAMTHTHPASATSSTNVTGNHGHLNGCADNALVNFVYSGTTVDMPGSATQALAVDGGSLPTTYQGYTNTNGNHSHTVTTSVTIANNTNPNSIYGNSTTVQPESVALRWFVVVGTGAINEAEMDWSAWATGLNGRANTDLSNLSTTGQAILDNKANTDLSNLSTSGQAVLSNKADVNASNFSASGKNYLSKIGMPSNRSIQLTVGATGTQYTAPANGYFKTLATTNSQTMGYVNLANNSAGISASTFNDIGFVLCVYTPVKAGDVVTYYYDLRGTNNLNELHFNYAEGAE